MMRRCEGKMQIGFMVLLILLLVLQSHMLQLSQSKSIVGNLPGFSGELPFELQTGYVPAYIGVGKNEDIQLFYYFVKSERNPDRDPLLLYLTGGPGTSGIIPFLYQIGPLNFKYGNENRSEVKLESNPYSWTKTANIIFIDLPVGTGFSYAKTYESSRSRDSLVVTHAYDFIRKWLLHHPTFLSNPLYITGYLTWDLSFQMSFQKYTMGFLIVNPLTDKLIDFNSIVEFAYRSGLMDDEIYESAKENCGGKYVYFDPNNTMCLNSLQRVNECLAQVNIGNILDTACNAQDPNAFCRESIYLYSNIWANTKAVRQALHIREVSASYTLNGRLTNDNVICWSLTSAIHDPFNLYIYWNLPIFFVDSFRLICEYTFDVQGTVDKWLFTNMSIRALYGKSDTIYYSYDIFSSLASHKQLLDKNCRALIINGDHDMTFPYVGTRQWIDLLNLKTQTTWKPWFVRTQIAGYFKTYSKAKYTLKYATIKDGGHSVALYKPEESMIVVQTWLDSHTNSTKS
ncbi:hypothetical protein OSB04_008621 [Centaurea solstitialis]|uniref:Peptidase S10, serine carboxypeptidase, Alpha/Beta hydrolase fold protein n=1 Tax=Centaurea solstitialis TaxID=347529 RepID=A0AA38TZX5_9ASTR|nr:hypothetical protein OSB04_008621 [Centaurea solstitialis]